MADESPRLISMAFSPRPAIISLAFLALVAACGAARREGASLETSRPLPSEVTLEPRPVLLRVAGTDVLNGGYGSSLVRDRSDGDRFYLLTDRGPNYQMPIENQKTFPLPSYAPRIGVFRLTNGVLRLERSIELKNASGTNLGGLPNPPGQGGTGEVALDSTGTILPFDPEGVDPEGLAVMNDGTFWVADEYGPSLLHLDAGGITIARLNPFSEERALPVVLIKRRPNRGIEGLAVTRDQRMLVGIMETPLDNPKAAGRVSRVTRIVVLDLDTGQSRQYAYLLERVGVSNNGLTALEGNQFLVLERDDKFPGNSADPSAFKRIYRIDLTNATDLSDPANGTTGKLFNGKTVEELTPEELASNGIIPVSKSLVVDLLSPALAYPHNKPEGLAVIDRQTIAVANDDDFGITDDGRGGILPKILPMLGRADQTTVRFIKVADPLY